MKAYWKLNNTKIKTVKVPIQEPLFFTKESIVC